jgi:hypothetical protein
MVGFRMSNRSKIGRSEYWCAVSFRQDHKRQVYVKRKINGANTLLVKIAGDEDQYIYVENKTISVTGIKPIKTNYKVTGSQSHNDFMDFQKSFNPSDRSVANNCSGY